MWYTPNRQLTYNRIWNFVVGVRGGGKTFNTLKYAIEKFLKDGTQFIYLRRQVVQLDDACIGKDTQGDLFAYIRHEGYFQDHELKVVSDKSGGYNFYCDDKIMGYGKALSTSMSRKSMALPKVGLIIFDEFMIDSTSSIERYLGQGDREPFIFENFYETVTRGRDIPVFFIGNAFSMVNPYFIHFDIRFTPNQEKDLYKGKFWTAVLWRDDEFIKTRAKTQFYQATKDTQFHDHAFGNTFYLDSTDFIKKRSKDSEHQFSLVYLGKTYGVWVDWDKGTYYVSTKGAKTSRDKTISMSLSDNKPNNINIRRYRNLPFMKAFRTAVDINAIYYDSQETYNMMNECVYLLKTIT